MAALKAGDALAQINQGHADVVGAQVHVGAPGEAWDIFMSETDAAGQDQIVVLDHARRREHPPSIAVDGDHRGSHDAEPLPRERVVSACDLGQGNQTEEVAQLRGSEDEEGIPLDEDDLDTRDEPLHGAGETDPPERGAHHDQAPAPGPSEERRNGALGAAR